MTIIRLIIVFFVVRISTSSRFVTATEETLDQPTEIYGSQDDTKCITDYEYTILMDSLVKQVAEELQRNNTNEAMKMLDAVAPQDETCILDVVNYTMNRSDYKLYYLLRFINQTASPGTRLHGFSKIFHGMNNNGTRGLLDWLDLEYFVRSSLVSEFENVEVFNLLMEDVRANAKKVLISNGFTENGLCFNSVRNARKCELHHLSFVVESYLDEDANNIKKTIRFLEMLESVEHKVLGFIDLYNMIANSSHLNNTFVLIPVLKSWTFTSEKNQRYVNKFLDKIPNNSTMKKILSYEYFLLRNVHNNGYLYIRPLNSKKNKKIILHELFQLRIRFLNTLIGNL